MRILLGAHLFYPEHRAGVETYTLQLAQALARRHEVLVVATEKVISRATGARRRYVEGGVSVVVVVNNLTFDDWDQHLADARMERAFAEILDEFRPDRVHLQHLMYWSLRLPEIAAARGIPVLMTLHDYWLECARLGQRIDAFGRTCVGASPDRCAPCLARTTWRQSGRATRWIGRLTAIRAATGVALDRPMRMLARAASALKAQPTEASSSTAADAAPSAAHAEEALWRARHGERRSAVRSMAASVDRFVTPSRTLRAAMISEGLPAERVALVPQGLDAAPFVAAHAKAPATPLRLAFIGTIAPHKGLHVLLEALASLPPGVAELTVHGPSQHHRAHARDLERRFGRLHGVRFAGTLARADLARAYEAIDVLCVPSLWNECCPLTIQESFLARVPVLVSDLGGMAELVQSGGGLPVPPGDVAAWAAAIVALAADPARIVALQQTLPRVATMDEHLAALEAIWEDVERAHPSSRRAAPSTPRD